MYNLDRKGPRMRKAQFSKMVVTKKLWRKFRRSNPIYKNITWDEFFGMWKDLAETIRNEAIFNPLGVKLEKFTGELKLQYLPHKKKVKDFGGSNEAGEEVNHLNINTRGKVGTIKWERRQAVKFNTMLQYYAFEQTREMEDMSKERVDQDPTSIRVSRVVATPNIWKKQ